MRPSPHEMIACRLAVPLLSASVKLATVPENDAPAGTLRLTLVATIFGGAGVTLARLRAPATVLLVAFWTVTATRNAWGPELVAPPSYRLPQSEPSEPSFRLR